MDPRERRALLVIITLAGAGHLLRAVRPGEAPGPARLEVIGSEGPGDPQAQLALAGALSQPLGATERIDIDRATAPELERLPGIGPALAARIVADRVKGGAFGGTDGLSRVPGIGPALLERIAPHLTFSGQPADASRDGISRTLSLNLATERDLERLPGIGKARAAAIIAFRDSAGPFRETGQLATLPGFPAKLVERLKPLVRID